MPLREISRKVEQLEVLGWREWPPMGGILCEGFPEGEDGAAEAEVRRVMGDYETETRALLRNLTHPTSSEITHPTRL